MTIYTCAVGGSIEIFRRVDEVLFGCRLRHRARGLVHRPKFRKLLRAVAWSLRA